MIKVTPADIERFLAEEDNQPVVMLNLLRFKADGGRQRYLDYLTMAGPIVSRVWSGNHFHRRWRDRALRRTRSILGCGGAGALSEPVSLRGHDR